MGLGPAAVKLYIDLWQRGMFKDIKSVIETGSQELHMTRARFEDLVKCSGGLEKSYNRADFVDIDNWPDTPRCSSRALYKLLGVEKYVSLDLNEEHGSIKHDLNEPFTDARHLGAFDLVTDHGTNEHAFNIAETYRTMHRLSKQNGYIVISQAVYGGNGYYNFDVPFFEGLAAANNYKILFCSYVVTTKDGHQFHIPPARELLATFDFAKMGTTVGITYVFQKLGSDEFNYPYQGTLMATMRNNAGYMLQFSAQPPSRTYVPAYWASDISTVGIKVLVRALIQKLRAKLINALNVS